MWIRKDLKERAKVVLKASYWKAFLVSLVLAISGGSSGAPSFNWNFGDGNNDRDYVTPFGDIDLEKLISIVFLSLAIAFLVILVALAFRIFLGYALEVGSKKYFIQGAQGEVNMNHLGFAFEGGRYMKILKAMLWKGVINFLWYLLFIIPGIVQTYAYRMVPYILAENPNIGYRRALELSSQMMKGHKFKTFVLDLSFIGWFLLGTLALVVGTLFVLPYYNATQAELYLALRQKALDSGLCSYDELSINQQ